MLYGESTEYHRTKTHPSSTLRPKCLEKLAVAAKAEAHSCSSVGFSIGLPFDPRGNKPSGRGLEPDKTSDMSINTNLHVIK